MKVYIGNTAKNTLGKVNQIWKSLSGIVLSNGTVAALVALGGATDSNGDPAGSVVVRDIGVISQSRNRNRSSVTSTREKVTWTTADNIREITVTALTTDTVASNDSEGLAFCVNAGSDAIADAWLTETDVEADDVQYELIKVNGNERTFRFTSALTRLDMVAVGGADTTFRVHIGAH